MDRVFLLLASLNGFLAVAFGAFGAHALTGLLERAEDGAKRAEWWATASQYHLAHALALGLAAWVVTRSPGMAPKVAGVAFAIGIVLFSGSLYTMTITGARWLGAVTPLGGTAFLVGWGALLFSVWRS